MPARSMTRADSSISSSGSIVSCITPMRNGGAIRTIFKRGQILELKGAGPQSTVRPARVVRHHAQLRVAERLVEGAGLAVVVGRQPHEGQAALPGPNPDALHQPR